MMKFKADYSGLVRLRATIGNQSKQVSFAAMRALNAAAYKASQETVAEIARVFDRPTPWVRRSVRYVKARRDRLEASVDFDFWGNKQGVTVSNVLEAEIYGGVRKLKRHEQAMRRIGVLPDGMAIVPGSAAQLDQYGNMSPGQINQILSFFGGFGEQGYKANMTGKGKARLAKGNRKKGTQGFAYFALARRHGRLLPGVYQRFQFSWGSAVKPIMIFVHRPQYRIRLQFYRVAEAAATKEFNAKFPVFLDEAMRTAR